MARALATPAYGIYTAGTTISFVGYWIQKIGVGWLAWELTGSGTWLGIIAFADLFPLIIFAPIAGALADRFDNIAVIRASQWLSCVQAATLGALTAAGWITIEGLVALTVCLGFSSALLQPAQIAVIPSLVQAEDLSAAVGLGSLSFSVARFIGPALAGLVIVTGGVAAAFAANALSYLIFLFMLAKVRPIRTVAKKRSAGGLPSQLAEGVRYAAGHPGIPAILVLVTVVALCGRPYGELLPGFADAVFAAGAEGLSILASSTGAGTVIGALWIAQRRSPRGLVRLILISILGLSLSLVAFGLVGDLGTAAVAVFVAGFFLMPVALGSQILVQLAVDEAMRGRVLALYVVLFRAMPAIGALIMGYASEHVGLGTPIVGGAVLMILVLAWAAARHRSIASAVEPGPVP